MCGGGSSTPPNPTTSAANSPVSSETPCPEQIYPGCTNVVIKGPDGTSPPCTIIPINGNIQLRAIPNEEASGTFQWTTTSTKVTLTNTSSDTVTVTAAAQVSSAKDAEIVKAIFTPASGSACQVTLNLTVIRVVFSESANQKYGYDNMDNEAGILHHVSVQKNDDTKVQVTIEGGATATDLQFTSDDTAIAEPVNPASGGSTFDLSLNGKDQDKAETGIKARCKCSEQHELAAIRANVYRQVSFTAKVAKIHDSTVASTALTRPNFDVEAAEQAINRWYKAAVVTLDLSDHSDTGGVIDVRYDLNNSGKLDLEPGTTSSEQTAIQAVFNPAGQKIVIVKDLAWMFFLKTAAAIDDTTITLKDSYADYMRYIVDGNSYPLGVGATAENITVQSKSGTTVTLAAPLTKAHTTSDGIEWPLSGLSGNPIYVAEQTKTEDKERQTMGHECGHSQLTWKDVESSTCLMHYSSGRTDTKVRFKEFPRKYDAGNESLWEKVPRS